MGFLYREESSDIYIDINRPRIKVVLSEAYDSCKDVLGVEFDIDKETFLKSIDPYLDSNRVSIPVQLRLPSSSFPELLIEVNLRKSGVFARLHNRKKQVYLNRYLTKL